MNQKQTIALVVIIAVVAIFITFVGLCKDDWCFLFDWQKANAADSFERCAALGFPIMESFPRQCRAGEKTFTEKLAGPGPTPTTPPAPVGNDKIKVTTPLPNAVVSSPLLIKGEARGTWYFEASFPVKILDANGTELGIVPAQAQGEWMTTEFVPFETSLTFKKPTTKTGTLVLQKDNPSGLPEYDDSVSIPVTFSQ